MAQRYDIRIVNEKEWKAAVKSDPRYKRVDETNLGFADAKLRRAYVRDTAVPALNRYLMGHEFEHLMEEKGTDEDEFGIRHKKVWKDIMSPFYRYALPIAGSFFGPIGGAIGGALGEGQYRATQARHSPTQNPWSAGLKGGAIGGAIGGTMGAAGNWLAGKPIMSPGIMSAAASKPASALAPGIQNAPIATSPAASGGTTALFPKTTGIPGLTQNAAGQYVPVSTGASSMSGMLSNMKAPTPFSGMTSAATNAAQPAVQGIGQATAATTGAQMLSQLTQNAKKLWTTPGGNMLASAGMMGAGQMFGKAPEVPNLGSLASMQALRNTIPGGASEIGKLARTKLTGMLSEEYSGLPQEILNDIKNTFNRRRDEVTAQFKMFRPGADLASDSAYRQAMQDIDREEAATASNQQLQYREQWLQGRRSDIATALGIDEQTLNTLMTLAQADIDQVQMQLGVDAATAQDFRNTFGQLASLFATKGLGLNVTPQINVSSLMGMAGAGG